ncbi:MAG: hypothetical protein GXP31_08280 [Kiritimatiellaeota bacterium]|nr:hypothetical protein [Kiritimatiellota bacterium]
MGQEVVLNQKVPVPIVAVGWSKALQVSGGPDSNYSLYLDLEYMDGTPLWGQTAAFETGTHDWRRATVTVMPSKPVRSVKVYGIFRGHAGTAWFDDFQLFEMQGGSAFDFVATAGGLPTANPRGWRKGALWFDPVAGAMTLDPGRSGGIVVRDVAAGSSFVLPEFQVQRVADGRFALDGVIEELGLRVRATLTLSADTVRLDGSVRDTRGVDRAVTVLWALPIPSGDWSWCKDPRTTVRCRGKTTYAEFRRVGAGVGGAASWYPFIAITGGDGTGLAIGAPIIQPRLWRFAFDAGRKVLYGACDLGLSKATKKFPSSASFHAVFFRFDPQWRFRSALHRYYDLNAGAFRRRVRKQGIWMPFTDIATVGDWEDFGFQFQEGAPNPAFDEAHGIYSFPYIEPMSYWMAMPKKMPRTNAAALGLLQSQIRQGNRRAMATLNSVLHRPDGSMTMGFHDTPWCDGALFLLNPDPDLAAPADRPMTQYRIHEKVVERILHDRLLLRAWGPYADGYETAEKQGRNDSTAAVCRRGRADPAKGLTQPVSLHQKKVRPLTVTAWSRCRQVTGEMDADYSLYVDLRYVDGGRKYGSNVPFPTGSEGWRRVTLRLVPEKPVEIAFVYLLFRGNHTGTVWFDDIALREEDARRSVLINGGFEDRSSGVHLDGLYLDSFEMAATERNYRRSHFASADIPLVFDSQGRVCQLGHFLAMELAMKTATDMHAAGKLLFANAVLHRFPWPAGLLDVFGTETNWRRAGKYEPDSDAKMLYWRAMCFKRPYLTLLNTRFEAFPHAWVEKYFARCCAYGVLPSMFSPEASGSSSYWVNPEFYNRDRDLFKKYIPVIRRIAEAGWEPIPWAEADDAAVWIERFGGGRPDAYLTVFNSGESHRSVTLRVNTPRLLGPGAVRVTQLLPARQKIETAVDERTANLRARLSLRPQQVTVLRLERDVPR